MRKNQNFSKNADVTERDNDNILFLNKKRAKLLVDQY
jgi:hypothetical protein